ncbi:MAG: hypothetical protein WCE90_05360 [Candidatus Zixiibacteriota bacterium]
MRTRFLWLLAACGCVLMLLASCQKKVSSVTVPVTLDHNRMLVDAEIQRKDGSWRKARLWIDTGNPDFFMSESLALDLGIDLSQAKKKTAAGNVPPFEVQPPTGLRIGQMELNFKGAKSMVMFEPRWLFNAMHNDANLPSTVLQKYQVVLDYPNKQLTLAKPGSLKPRGVRAAAGINPQTGIVQIDATLDGDSSSFALDNGASYSFVSDEVLARLSQRHPSWPRTSGALGCANIWGWWPQEPTWQVMRLPQIQCGSVRLSEVGMVGLPRFFPNGSNLGEWYSKKTARPVDGFLGPNAFKAFRVEIDYANCSVYFEKGAEFESHDMDLVGLTLRPEADGSYQVIGVAQRDGKPVVEGVEPGDVLLQVGDLKTTGATMGTVVDALRGKPGEVRTLVLERNGILFGATAKVERFL